MESYGSWSIFVKQTRIKKFEKFYSFDNSNNQFTLNMKYFTFPYQKQTRVYFSKNLVNLLETKKA